MRAPGQLHQDASPHPLPGPPSAWPGAQPGSPGKCSGALTGGSMSAHMHPGWQGLTGCPRPSLPCTCLVPPGVGLMLLTVALGKLGEGGRDTPFRGLCLFSLRSENQALLSLVIHPRGKHRTHSLPTPNPSAHRAGCPLSLWLWFLFSENSGHLKHLPSKPASTLPAPPHSLLSGSCSGQNPPSPPQPQPLQPLPSLTVIILSASLLPKLSPCMSPLGSQGPQNKTQHSQ